MKSQNKKGISLIVLIITIVVIIILAAAIILNLKDTNIIGNANEAVVKQDFKTFESELDLYIADEYVELKGKLDVTTIDATTKEDVVKIIPSIKGSRYEDYVTIIDGKIAISDTMPEEEKEWANEVIDLEIATPVIQAGTEVTTVNSSITGKSFSSTNPVIPVGFKTSLTGASWIVKDGIVEGWNDGLVIEDASGNEFVWVPCTLDGANGSIKYAKNFTYPNNFNASAENTIDDLDALPIKNGTIVNEIDQITKYGGFYIGRYEVGIPSNQDKIDGKAPSTSDVEGVPVVQKGSVVWTYISYAKAMTNAKKLYENSTSVRSGIVTGTAWDTVSTWVDSEKDLNGNKIYNVTDSINWGNYSDTDVSVQYDIDGITKISGAKQTTGKSEKWKSKNIYDFAGNTWEFTSEKYSSTSITRGGNYNGSGSKYSATFRDGYPRNNDVNEGFRIMLYVM